MGTREVLKGGSSSRKPEKCEKGECTRKPMMTTDEGDEPLGDDELLVMMLSVEQNGGANKK